MRQLLLVGLVLVAGCVTYPLAPDQISIVAEPVTQVCTVQPVTIPVRLTVRNRSRGTLHLWINPGQSRPYELSWISYAVLSSKLQEGEEDFRRGPGGHGIELLYTLSIGPGDSTQVVSPIYEISTFDSTTRFRVRIKDPKGHAYLSDWFFPCRAPG